MQNELIIETINLVKDYFDGDRIIHALRDANIKIYR